VAQISGFRKNVLNSGLVIFSVAVLFSILCPGKAFSQAARGMEGLARMETRRFSIFYPLRAESYALRVANMADSTLESLEALFGASFPYPKKGKKFPILVTDIQPWLNGYFSPYPSNRIVIFIASSGLEGLASFEDEAASVLLHELVHALTLNIKSGFWRFLSAFSGDVVAPGAWIMPNALVEGSAVWAESLEMSGRLDDPAALAQVALDLDRGEEFSLWDVSGLLDYPGSGNSAYLYGGLFAQYLFASYGADSLSALWAEAGKGNIFRGFHGAADSAGLPSGQLWKDFGFWLAEEFPGISTFEDEEAWRNHIISLDLNAVRFGPIALGSSSSAGAALYYVDQEKAQLRAVALSSRGVQEGQPKSLFAVDGAVEEIQILSDLSNSQEVLVRLRWYTHEAGGGYSHASYLFNPRNKKLVESKEETFAVPGEAARNRAEGQPYLYQASIAENGRRIYGLARIGDAVLLGRQITDPQAGEDFELLALPEEPLRAIRFLSLDDKSPTGRTRIALGFVPKGGIPSLALMDCQAGETRLWVQKRPLPGGIGRPSIHGNLVAFARDAGRGKEGIAILDLESLESSAGGFENFFEEIAVRWVPLKEWRTIPIHDTSAPNRPVSKAASIFPRLLETVRYPFWENDALGIRMEGQDLSERLAWEFQAGWDLGVNRPELGFMARASLGNASVLLGLQDLAVPSLSGEPFRFFIAQMGYGHAWPLLPARRRFYLDAGVFLAPFDSTYSLRDYFSPSFEALASGGIFALGYSDLRISTFAPFSILGTRFKAGLEMESQDFASPLLSLSASTYLAPRASWPRLEAYGSFTLSKTLRFAPAGRRIATSSGETEPTYRPSSMSPSFPRYKEYEALDAASPWYGFLQITLPLASLDFTEKAVHWGLKYLPSPAARRLVLESGGRLASFELNSAAIFLGSIFLGASLDTTLLAGLASVSTLSFSAEISYAAAPQSQGGGGFHFGFGIGVDY
jgi:hypothetical protein